MLFRTLIDRFKIWKASQHSIKQSDQSNWDSIKKKDCDWIWIVGTFECAMFDGWRRWRRWCRAQFFYGPRLPPLPQVWNSDFDIVTINHIIQTERWEKKISGQIMNANFISFQLIESIRIERTSHQLSIGKKFLSILSNRQHQSITNWRFEWRLVWAC